MSLSGIFKSLAATTIVLLFITGCSKPPYNPELADYLKAERELRKRVKDARCLEDSIKVLQQKYELNLEEEISRLNNNPELWVELLTELKIEE
ncbi:MAG TPA: hypothetical protein ENI34_03195 [candidate division WOR-3 bacterium]|uniref:Uncharacterized protein n=1 Tax=candidate division WOR-3 bacterium TaxID=2052148 RepID=A0A9C9JZI2_UNCW3|nr:hypothetical protein [candidate division WOR-3 bacterium]